MIWKLKINDRAAKAIRNKTKRVETNRVSTLSLIS